MPNPDYSYAGWNPGAGLTDFADTMRQGYLDQQKLKQQQFENLLQAQTQEQEHGAPGAPVTINPDSYMGGNLTQNFQGLASSVPRTQAPIINAQGQTVQPAQALAGQSSAMSAKPAPALTAPTLQAKAAQAGIAPASGPEDLKNDQADPGVQSDGSFVAKNGTVMPADAYRHWQQMGANVDPDTGRITMEAHDAYNYYNESNKAQQALAQLGSRFVGNMGQVDNRMMLNQYKQAFQTESNKAQVDNRMMLNQYKQAFQTIQSPLSTADQKAQASKIIQTFDQRLAQRTQTQQTAPAQQAKAPPSKDDVEAAIQKYMAKWQVSHEVAAGVVSGHVNGQ